MMAVGVIIDRPTAVQIATEVKDFGGAWTEMFEVWQRTSLPYLVMLAHTSERIRLQTPLTFMCADDDALRVALRQACGLVDMKCRWALFVAKDSAAEQIVRRELLADSIVEGCA